MKRSLSLGLAVLALGLPAQSALADSYNGHALTPPMGYNTWNAFACNINEGLIKSTALAMKNNGMADAGYKYVNLDDCWQDGRTLTAPDKALAARDAAGHIISDPTNFPSGVQSLADYVHSLGMKFGLYSSNGTATCQQVAGTLGHETIDAQDYAKWGIDYFKQDTCSSGLPADPKAFYTRYKVFSDALLATGRDIVLSLCDFTRGGQTWLWGAEIGNLWRTTGDISANFTSMLANFTSNQTRESYAGPGHWNDPDMLEIGTGGFSTLAAPLRVGDTSVQVADAANAVPGSALRVGTLAGGDLDSYIVSSVGTAAGAPTSVFAPASAGDTNLKVDSVSGFTVGNPLLLDTNGTYESPTITSVGTAGAATTLADAASAGDSTLKVASVSNLEPGDKLKLDDETATIGSVSSAAGPATALAAPAAAGDTSIKTAAIAGFTTGDRVLLNTGSGIERATITSVGTAAGAATTTADKLAPGATNVKVGGTATTLSAASAAGATNVKVASIANLVAGNLLTIDSGSLQETAPIASVGTAGATGTGVTLASALASAHASAVPAATIAGYKVGDTMSLDTGQKFEAVTVKNVGTPASAATTTVNPTAVDDTNIKVTSTAGFVVGHNAVMWEGGLLNKGTPIESAKITAIGTAAGAATTLTGPAAVGDTNIKVNSIAGYVAGGPLQIRMADGSRYETATVKSIGTAAGAATTLAKPASAGDINVKVASVDGYVAGELMTVGVGKIEESALVTSVGTAGADGTGITLATPLKHDHLVLILTRGMGTGIELTAPLSIAHPSGSTTRGLGTGITVEPLAVAHPLATTAGAPGGGISIRDAGTGIDVTPVANAHNLGVATRGLGTGVGVSPLAKAHALGVAARDTGIGVTLTAPLAADHAAAATVRDQSKPGTGITFSPALSSTHAIGAVTRGGGTGIKLTTPVTQAHANNAAIGKSGLSIAENKTHLSLWAMAAAPLLAGTDVVNIAKENLAIYLNKDVIAIDQDPLGDQAETVSNLNDQWKLKRTLANGDRAVALFNAASSDWLAASADFASLGLDPTKTYLAKDLWTKDISAISDQVLVGNVPAHATSIYRLSTRAPELTVPTSVSAQSLGANGIAVDYSAKATDALGGAVSPSCSRESGTLFPIGPTTVTCTATDAAGRASTSSFVVNVAAPQHPVDVGGTVPATLSLTLGSPATFGAFTPGVAKVYTAATTANVVSTAGDAALSVTDPSTIASGRLVNGSFSLPQALLARASSANGTGGPFAALGALLSYSQPVSNDAVSIEFQQPIGATDALRTGSYSKTLTFTLSTTTP